MLRTRQHSRRTVGTALVVAALMLLLAAPAGAQGPPQAGSGNAVVDDFIIPAPGEPGGRVDLGNSGNWRQTRTLEGTVTTGPLAGSTFEQTVTGVVRTDANFVTFHGTMTVEGPFADFCDGVDTITLGVTGRGQANPPVTEASVHVIDSSPGGVTGRGTVSQEGPFLSYDIQYICQ
jgi:hypothetical protein